ncbi:MAG: hypothetical protein ACRDT7_10130 [Microbacterium sp.]
MQRRLLIVLLFATVACGSSAGGGDGGGDGDAVVERSCEIIVDITNDAADSVDTLAETRDRFKDLLDGYGVSLPAGMQADLRDVVSALTTGDNTLLESALNGLVAAC